MKKKIKEKGEKKYPSMRSTLGQTPGSIHMLLAKPVLKIKTSWTQ